MTKYEKQILNVLIDKYEGSKSFIGTNQVNQSFTCKLDQLFPKYKDDSEYDLFCAVNESVDALVEEGFVTVKKLKNRVIQSVTLNLEDINKVYEYLGRTPKSAIVIDLKKILIAYKDCNVILSVYCSRQLERLAENKSVEFFDDDFDIYESILKIVSKITEVKNETFERDFSIQVLGDSKAFEKIRSKVISLLYEYGDFPDRETLLADLNIVKNPGHVYFKGKGKLTICGQQIDFSQMPGDMAISSEMLKNVDDVTVFGDVVITIENLTTFNTFNCEKSFAIYLGGYHNTSRRNFIKKVYEQNPDKQYLHFGDIDAGGIHILKHLRAKTNIQFLPYKMDVETLSTNMGCWKKLTDNDIKRLRKIEDKEFQGLIDYMLSNNCKLEQEAIDWK